MAYRAYGEWVIVQADPRVKKTAGGLFLTEELTQIERTMEGTGVILSVGHLVPGDLLKTNNRVCFRGFLKDAHKLDKTKEGADIFLIHFKDLLATLDDGVTMGFFSRA